MITITRLLARQLRGVFRRTFGSRRNIGPAVSCTAGPEGLSVKANGYDAAIEYRSPGKRLPEQITVPFELLADCEGRKDQPVTIERLSGGHVAASWRDGDVPQMIRYDAVPDGGEFPTLPETFAQNPPMLLPALRDAGSTTDPDCARFALDHVQLRGSTGTVAATDGRQLLLHGGFQFPWKEDLLVPALKVFGSAELPQDQPVEVGKSDDWVAIRVGPWTFWLAVNKEGRFPDIDRQIPCPTDITARVCFDPADAEFLSTSLPRLPCDDEFNLPVTVDLNGSVAIRAKGEMPSPPTELVLCRSTLSGAPIRVNTNRNFLARALKLGFRELLFHSPKTPVLCQDDNRRYAWAVLDHDSAIASTTDAVRILSSDAAPAVSAINHNPKTPRRKISMPRCRPQPNGHVADSEPSPPESNGCSAPLPETDLLEQAQTLKVSLGDALAKTNALIVAIKGQEKQRRIMRSTLASLRQLQSIDA